MDVRGSAMGAPARSIRAGQGRQATNSAASFTRGTAMTGVLGDGQPSYGIDVVALAFAVVLAAVLALLLSHLVPQLVELIR